jgi:hypothetical protein
MSEDNITITIPDAEFEDAKIDMSKYTTSIYNNNISPTWGTLNSAIGANGSSGNYYGNANYTFSSAGTTTADKSLKIVGDAEFDGDVKIKGVSILEYMDKINQRLSILVPDPAKLEHFEALKRAYENYKTLEALCELPSKND